jgi:hypothetical protein
MFNMKKLYITLICDYGQGDLAFIECYNEFIYQFSGNFTEGISKMFVNTISTQAFNTIQNGFFVGQIANNSKLAKDDTHLVFHNCAPRKDDMNKRENNDEESLAFSELKNGVIVIGVNSGYSFSFIKEDVYLLNCDTKGSQFRSRDIFPKYIKEIFQHSIFQAKTSEMIGEFQDPHFRKISSFYKTNIPVEKKSIPENVILHIDGYGNIKNNINLDKFEDGSFVNIKIKNIIKRCIISKGGIFSVKDGDLVLSYGSSGWNDLKFSEIVLRGDSASDLFDKPNPSDLIEVFNG